MIDWSRLTPADVVLFAIRERRRLSSVSSTSGLDQSCKLPSQRPIEEWETLLLLMRGVTEEAATVLEAKIFGTSGSRPQEQSMLLESSGHTLRWYEEQAMPLSTREIARVVGKPVDTVRKLIADAYDTVAENMAQVKGRK